MYKRVFELVEETRAAGVIQKAWRCKRMRSCLLTAVKQLAMDKQIKDKIAKQDKERTLAAKAAAEATVNSQRKARAAQAEAFHTFA